MGSHSGTCRAKPWSFKTQKGLSYVVESKAQGQDSIRRTEDAKPGPAGHLRARGKKNQGPNKRSREDDDDEDDDDDERGAPKGGRMILRKRGRPLK